MISKLVKKAINAAGYEIHRIPRRVRPAPVSVPSYDKVHYGCGRVYLNGWLNTDIILSGPENYMYVDLTGRHPFPDDFFRFAFSEDFIEHIDQAASLMFLVEVHRTLRRGGVFRMTTPALEQVLALAYSQINFDAFEAGRETAFFGYGHIHFYSRESLRTVARHIGFDVVFVESGVSKHPELNGINTRDDPVYLHAELTKKR